MKITPKTELCTVIKEAAKRAKGRGELLHGKDSFCLWGQTAYMCGVAKAQLRGGDLFGPEGDRVQMYGMSQWDSGNKKQAVREACTDEDGGGDVKGFRRFLTKRGYKLGKVRS